MATPNSTRTPMTPCDTPDQALQFVQHHGVVLASAKGSVPRLTEAIAGEAIKGSWWSHPQGRRIFAILSAVTDSDQILVCRLIDNKITLVHRRLWPHLVSLAVQFEPRQIARVTEEHTPSGRHASTELPFPDWVPGDVLAAAGSIRQQDAVDVFGPWLMKRPAG
jgi:hypothetical protein